MNNNKKIAFAIILLYSSLLTVTQASASINIPITNPGAETGDLTGWETSTHVWPFGSTGDYFSYNDPTNANSGSHYFGLSTGLDQAIPASASSLAGSFFQTQLTSSRIDLSAYTGQIDNLFVFASMWNSSFSLTVETDSASYHYGLISGVGANLFDSNGDNITDFGSGVVELTNWSDIDSAASSLNDWQNIKSDVASMELWLLHEFIDSSNSGAPRLEDIDLDTVISAEYSWTDKNGEIQVSEDLLSASTLPIIGFDDVRLELTTVPLPGAAWLLSLALAGLVTFQRRN